MGATLVAAKELRTKTVIVANLRMFMPGRIQAMRVPDDKPIFAVLTAKTRFFPECHKNIPAPGLGLRSVDGQRGTADYAGIIAQFRRDHFEMVVINR